MLLQVPFGVSIGIPPQLADLTLHNSSSARGGLQLGRAAMPAQMWLLCMVGCGTPVTGCGGGQSPLTAPACGAGNACSASAAASPCVSYRQHRAACLRYGPIGKESNYPVLQSLSALFFCWDMEFLWVRLLLCFGQFGFRLYLSSVFIADWGTYHKSQKFFRC